MSLRHASDEGIFEIRSKNVYNFDLRNLISEAEGKPSEVKSIRRIAIILSCICNGINSLADISEYSKMSRSTVHRLLKGLEKSHLVIHDPVSRRYYLGSLIRHLVSNPQVTHEYLVSCAYKEMERLAAVTEETVVLSVKIGLNHAALQVIPSTHELRIVGLGKMLGPLHVGAGGKVLLSQLNDNELKEAVKNIQFGPETTISKEDLIAQIKQIKRQGYAITHGERVFGATIIAAPIQGYETPAALSIIGPDARMKPKIESFLERLLVAADRISLNVMESRNEKKAADRQK